MKTGLSDRIFTLATCITTVRIICAPFVAQAIIAHSWGAALLLFALSALSDALDGYCARLFNARSTFGAMLDPLADKFLMLAIYGSFFVAGVALPCWFIVGVLVKEIVLILFALGAVFLAGHSIIVPHMLGKWAMALQVALVIFIMIIRYGEYAMPAIIDYCVVAVFFVVCAALVRYLYGGVWALYQK